MLGSLFELQRKVEIEKHGSRDIMWHHMIWRHKVNMTGYANQAALPATRRVGCAAGNVVDQMRKCSVDAVHITL